MARHAQIAVLLCAGVLCCSCSAALHLSADESRLVSNTLVLPDTLDIQKSALAAYIKQQPKFGGEKLVFNEGLMNASARSIEKRLEYLGYYGSSVQPSVKIKNQKARVTYNVIPGNRYQIGNVTFELPKGTDFINDFYADTANINLKRGSFLSESALEEESARSASALRSKGYFALNKTAYTFSADSTVGGNRADIIYKVSETGYPFKKTYFADVTLDPSQESKVSDKVLSDINLIHSGEPYTEAVVNNTYSRFSSLKMFSSVGIVLTQVSEDSLDCDINLTPSLPQGFKANLEMSTNSSALIGISPQFEYYHKNIFGGGEWLTIGFTGNLQFRLDNSLRATESGISASLSLPRFLGIPYKHFPGAYIPRTEFNLSFNGQNRPEYERNIFAFSMGYNGRMGDNLYYKFYPLSVNYVYMGQIDPDFEATLSRNPYMRYTYQDHLDAGVSITLYHTTSQSVVPRGDYRSNRFTADLSGNVLSLFKGLMSQNSSGQAMLLGSPFSQYVKGEYSYSQGIALGSEGCTTLAFRALCGAGYAYGNSTSLPYEKQFYCGGAQSMRGWQVRSLGPGASALDESFAIPSQTGDFKLEADAELRFPISGILEGALFTEVGNVWNINELSGDFYKELGADYGLGLRFNLDFLLIRLDMGIILHDPSSEVNGGWLNPWTAIKSGDCAVHFGVGYPF